MTQSLKALLLELMQTPGLSGSEGRVRRKLKSGLADLGVAPRTDRAGNLIFTLPGGKADAPSVMLFTHMDQLGLIVRKVEQNGLLRVERMGGVPEKVLAGAVVLCCIGEGRDRLGVIANKSHHATPPEEKYKVVPYAELFIDVGAADAAEVRTLGIDIGTPVVYEPRAIELAGGRVAGTSVDDRAGCAVLTTVARMLHDRRPAATVHCVFTVQEEFNLRGAVVAAQELQPDIGIQLDLILATDTPDLAGRGDVRLGGGPGMSLYNFHGRGTLNGLIPHPALVHLFEQTASRHGIPLQRAATVGVLTDNAYVQLVHHGVACIDMGFPMRYSHSQVETCDPADLQQLAELLAHAIHGIDTGFTLDRDQSEA
jgi:putative aminopeptidase FrvX